MTQKSKLRHIRFFILCFLILQTLFFYSQSIESSNQARNEYYFLETRSKNTQNIIQKSLGTPFTQGESEFSTLTIGISQAPTAIDPLLADDAVSQAFISQICEPLFEYNKSDPNNALIPILADSLGIWDASNLSYTLTLRQDIIFHDGTPFNSSAVKWNFDRIQTYLSEIKDSDPARNSQFEHLYFLYCPLGMLYPENPFIINNVIILDESTIEFELSYRFSWFLEILCDLSCYMISPESTVDSSTHIVKTTETLIGTGQLTQKSLSAEEIRFSRFETYTRGSLPYSEIIWQVFSSAEEKYDSLIQGEIDAIDYISPDQLSFLASQPNYTVSEFHTFQVESLMLGMNNKKIDLLFRRVINYGLDYNELMADLFGDYARRLTSYIPTGINYHNPNVTASSFDLIKARQILVKASYVFASQLYNDTYWISLTQNSPIRTYTYHFPTTAPLYQAIGTHIQSDLSQLGIRVNLQGISIEDYDRYTQIDYDNLELFLYPWLPRVNSPVEFITSLFSNTSIWNLCQVNDPFIQIGLIQAMFSQNPVEISLLYNEIQSYLVEDLMPMCLLCQPFIPKAHTIILSTFMSQAPLYLGYRSLYWISGIPTENNDIFKIKGYNILYLTGYAILGLIGILLVIQRPKIPLARMSLS